MKNEIVLFKSQDGAVSLPVSVEADTVWLTQAQMAQLFGRSQPVIARHIKNAFDEGEVNRDEAYAKIAYLAENAAGAAKVAIYNLDVIISVGYRVKSQRGVECRRFIDAMKFSAGSALFGNEKDGSFKSALGAVYRRSAGRTSIPPRRRRPRTSSTSS